MSKSSDAVKRWRKTAKTIIITCMGGCCQICKYSKCSSALELHHVDPSEKEVSLSQIMTKCRSWDVIYAEISKCILLCSNCHREVHAGITVLPDDYKKFSEGEADALRSANSLATQKTNAVRNKEARKRISDGIRASKLAFNEARKKAIINSGIDMSKWGALTELANHLGISRVTLSRWLKRHMPLDNDSLTD